jgi:phage terminase large subunit-like protein
MTEFLAERYVEDVLAGRRVECRWVRLACERHRRDLDGAAARGLWFDERGAKLALAFFGLLRHSKGEWAGRPVALEGWQQFHLWNLFGWKREDGTRRFRVSYLEVGRKNGKSTMGAGVGLFLQAADGEPGAEIYTAATKRDQARIVHQEAVRMVKQSPALGRELRVFKDNIHSEKTFSKFEPLGRDSGTLDGLNVHGAIVDELHAHPTGDMWDVLQTATGARRQPLLYAVTTAGSDRQSLCWQFHDYTEKVLSGVLQDDAWHGLIYTLDRDGEGLLDDWEDEGNWYKSNPNLGVSKKLDDLRDKARVAKGMPARLNGFLQKELNIWTQASTRWIDPEAWRGCNLGPVDEEELVGRECWGGLDLSSTLDVTALVWVFPAVQGSGGAGEQGRYEVVCRFWVPEENVGERVKRDRVPYDVWIRQGWVRPTPGNVVDYEFILAQIRADMGRFKVRELAFDPWNATSTSNKLIEEGAKMVEFRQGFVSMNPAMKTLEVAIQKRALNHGGNPALAWMADNLVATSDPAGNLKPDKGKSTEKIDGMVALLMALQRAALAGGERESVYRTRGLRVL